MNSNTNNISDIINLFSKGRFPKGLEEEVQRWLVNEWHAEAKEDSLVELWNELDGCRELGQDSRADKRRAFARLSKRLGLPGTKGVSLAKRALRIAAVVVPAVVMLAIGGRMLLRQQAPQDTQIAQTVISAVDGATEKTVLPDGTTVWLKSGSSITYDSVFDDRREVRLLGEAYFSVVRQQGEPFVVRTEHLAVTVLGTQFSVCDPEREGRAVVALDKGSVAVAAGSQRVTMKPGELLTYELSGGGVTLAEGTHDNDWMGLVLDVKYKSVHEILATVEHIYGVNIEYSGSPLSDEPLSVQFKDGETIEGVLSVLSSLTGGFDYIQQGDTIIISNR